MKDKIVSVVALALLCFAFISYANSESAGLEFKDPKDGLNYKIEEITSVLHMLRLLKNEELTAAYFQKLQTINGLIFKKARVGEYPDPYPVICPKAMAKYWLGIDGRSEITFEEIKKEIIPRPSIQDSQYEIDFEAQVVLKYNYSGSPEHTGEVSFTLFHMKRCIWD